MPRLHTRPILGWKPPLGQAARVFLLALAIGVLGACSTVDGMFGGDSSAPAGKPGAAGVPGTKDPIPNLASVPGEVPKTQNTAEERKKLAEALLADNKGVK